MDLRAERTVHVYRWFSRSLMLEIRAVLPNTTKVQHTSVSWGHTGVTAGLVL